MTRPWIRAKRVGIVFLSFVAVSCVLSVWVFLSSKPPREARLIENFYAHRTAYEHLRDMLLEDKQVLGVASWGVETKSLGISKPPAGSFPINRYNEYIALLKETGGIGAFRGGREPSETLSIGVYASGWAGNTRHVEICWMEQKPASQVMSLEDFYQTPKPRSPVYRHIDGNWYLWADW